MNWPRLVAAGTAVLCALMSVSGGGRHLWAADIEAGEDAVLLEENLDIEIVSETLARVRYFNRTKVLTVRGVEEHEVASAFYNPSITLREMRGAVISPEGKRSEVKKRQIFDRAAFESFELYADSKNRSILFPGVVPGSTIEHEYEVEVRNLFFLQGYLRFDLQERIPVRLKTFTVHAPASFALRLATQGTPEYVREEKEGPVVHRWRVRDVPALKDEYGMPPNDDVVPYVQIYLRAFMYGEHRVDASDWNGIARWTRDLSRDRELPTAEVAAKARELTAGITDPKTKAQRVYEFVQKNINYVAIELGIGGLQPHDNGSVLRNRYGDCKDKATLLIAMSQAVGVRAYPVLILTRDDGLTDRDYPSSHFNHVIAALPTEDGYLFMDPTSENTPFGDLPWTDQGANALVVKEDGSGDMVQTPLLPPERSRIHWQVTATLQPDGDLEGNYAIEAWGQDRAEFAAFVADTKPAEREDALARFMARICPGAVLQGQDVIPPANADDSLKITIRFKVPRFLVRAGNLDVFSLHIVRFPYLAPMTTSDKRQHSIFLPRLSSETAEVHLYLPSGRHLKKIPTGRTLQGPGVSGTTSYEITNDGRRDILVVKRSIIFNRREIPASEYNGLRESVAAIIEEESRAVTLLSGSS